MISLYCFTCKLFSTNLPHDCNILSYITDAALLSSFKSSSWMRKCSFFILLLTRVLWVRSHPQLWKRSALLDVKGVFYPVYRTSCKKCGKKFRASGASTDTIKFYQERGRTKNRQCKIWSKFYVKVHIFRIRTLPNFGHRTPLDDLLKARGF